MRVRIEAIKLETPRKKLMRKVVLVEDDNFPLEKRVFPPPPPLLRAGRPYYLMPYHEKTTNLTGVPKKPQLQSRKIRLTNAPPRRLVKVAPSRTDLEFVVHTLGCQGQSHLPKEHSD